MSKGTGIAITGTGVVTPEYLLTNEEMCEAFNKYVKLFNEENADAIAAGEIEALKESDPAFIENASGIKQRYVHEKEGILDPRRMCPNIPDRSDDEVSVQAEFAVRAAEKALEAAGRVGEDIDMIILATANLQRMYPAVAMEVQDQLGARGFAYDISVGCSSATFPIQIATDALRSGSATCALVVNPEVMCGHLNWRDRDSHFIFGDAATAVVLEPIEDAKSDDVWEILGTRLMSKFSSNIRNNGGFLNRCDPEHRDDADKLFYQQGRKVFKDIVPLASAFISGHVESVGLDPLKLDRYWLHQANANMNRLISKRILGREATTEEAPQILDRYANTASCGSIIAFDHHHKDLPSGSTGVLCSFGAGYSIGSVVVQRR
jgi:beta-ketodecanoyl-[acyl-carrier-protein] synthase